MASIKDIIKQIVASGVAVVGFSLPGSTETLDEMFESLGAAQSAEEAARIEERIATEWSRSGSAAIDLLWQRGIDALENGDPGAAAEHFTAAIDHAPDFAEAYNGRATAYFMLDLYGPALDDIRQVLVLNPRHYGAMRGFAIILEEIGEEQEALEVIDAILAINPLMDNIEAARDRLVERLNGVTL
ncbi:tetratricopeptide repeat protein [Roseisalinus antarcticus]|uniref:Tetratricopeptide repeat protein n=1 Tax=Roseisalinus antarcticus TaxID=254357 RepID=A0A1Y5RWT0_9RHOB|nr:tetratricopeptide repeat protein [Roseisalinus antarcticus]SLN27425.1 Tetratricopeptide repeat protein [Roseisalinus antarcticus]